MKFSSNLAIYFFACLIFASYTHSQRPQSCSYGTFFNGAACQDCGISTVNPNVRIVGGISAIQNSLPSQVYLRIYKTGNSYVSCGGTLISRKTVLTAAHCMVDAAASSVRVYLGAYDLRRLGNPITATKVVIHSSYSKNSQANDIALIHLSSAATLSASVGVACLPQSSSTYPPAGTNNVLASGWGTLTEGGSIPSILQNVKLSVYAASSCRAYNGFNNNNQVCAGEINGGKDTCQGDSGGPLYRIETIGSKVKQVVTGVTSFGFGCARRNTPGVYTRVASYLQFIQANMIF